MAYDDKDDRKFPTRTGLPTGTETTGTANERSMLDSLGGSDNIRTKIQYSEDNNSTTTTTLRTRAGNPEFVTEVTGGEEEYTDVYMDTGAVDLLSIAPNNPLTGMPAPLYYGDIQRSYVANKKLLGEIPPPSIKTPKPPTEGLPGKSFKGVSGDDLVGKKECIAKCPASMFTGKTRLYVQAIYGRKLSEWDWELDIPLGLSPRIKYKNSAIININSGVYRDDQYKHWLLTIHPGGILVTKLVRDERVDDLVPHLRNANYQSDWDKIEAYILAYSTPSESISFNIDTPVPETQMLGYGWKFNWGGNKADIIQHVEGHPKLISTHYRFEFFRNSQMTPSPSLPPLEQEALRWQADLSIVEGPVEWHNPRFSQVIAYPDWLLNYLAIFGTTNGINSGNNIPVYCFYDEAGALEVFRFTFIGGASSLKSERVSQPPSWGLNCSWTADPTVAMNATVYDVYGTFGTDGGNGEWRQRVYDPSTTGFSCSRISTVSSYQSYSYQGRGLGGKTLGPYGYGYNDNFDPQGVINHTSCTYTTSTFVLSDGVVATQGGGIISYTPQTTGPGYFATSFTIDTTLNGLSYEEGSHTEEINTLFLIPFHDAEAVYVNSTKTTTRTASGWENGTEYSTTSSWGTLLQKFNSYDGGYTYVQEGEWLIRAAHSSSWVTPTTKTDFSGRVTTTNSSLGSMLVTRSGGYDFTPPASLSAFFSGAPVVEQQYVTHSSTLGPAYGHGANNLEGFPDRFESPPPFIGWV